MTRRRRGDPVGIRDLQAVGQLDATALRALEEHGLTGSTRRAARELARQRERAFGEQLRAYLKATEEIRVSFHRPRWLPEWAYRRLLRSISIQTRAAPTAGLPARTAPRPERSER